MSNVFTNKARAAAAILIVLLGVMMVPRILKKGDHQVPAELLGAWTTDAPRYADRGFTITPTTLMLQQGNGAEAVYPIRTLRTRASVAGIRYDIEYGDRDVPGTFSLESGNDATLRFANQKELEWYRKR